MRNGAPYVVLFVLALALRLWMPGPTQVTTDEPLWLLRSQQFSKAISQGDLSKATAWGAVPGIDYPTMPGATTMWAGTAGRLATRAGSALGVNAPLPADPLTSSALVRWSRSMVALMVSAGLLAFVWAASRVVGRGAAFVAGGLCAIEPWFIGHSFLLHTDALVTVFGATSLVAMLAALRPRALLAGETSDAAPRSVDRTMLVLSAVTGALAVATKLNGLVLVGGGAAVVAAWCVGMRIVRAPRGARWAGIGRLCAWGVVWLLALGAVFVAVWPAVWAGPGRVVHDLRLSASNPGPFAAQFFFGANTHDPGWRFYPVTLAFRLSPWLMIGSIVAVLVGLARLSGSLVARFGRLASVPWAARLPRLPWVLLAALAPYALVISHYERKYDRYALVFVPTLALLTGVVVAHCGRWAIDHLGSTHPARFVFGLAGVVALGLVISVAGLAPNQISYVNPLLGGQKRAQHVMMLGWGEGGATLGRVIAGREEGRCDAFGIARPSGNVTKAEFPCGKHIKPGDLKPGDYLVLDLNQVQRGYDLGTVGRRVGVRFTPLTAVTIGGIAYSTLYQAVAA